MRLGTEYKLFLRKKIDKFSVLVGELGEKKNYELANDTILSKRLKRKVLLFVSSLSPRLNNLSTQIVAKCF